MMRYRMPHAAELIKALRKGGPIRNRKDPRYLAKACIEDLFDCVRKNIIGWLIKTIASISKLLIVAMLLFGPLFIFAILH